MRNYLQSEITLIFVVCATGLGLGFMIGMPMTGLILGLIGYIGWILHQIRLLSLWLHDSETIEPPHLHGIFELILDRSLRASRQHNRELQLLRATLNRQNRLISGVRDAVLLVDKKNRVGWYNQQAAEILQFKKTEDIGIPLGNIVRDPRFFNYMEAKEYAEPLLIRAPRNRSVWLELSVSTYEHGDKIIVLRDVTKMHQLEQIRSDFIANLSHELRTPLTVLRGYIETLHLQSNMPSSTSRIFEEMSGQSERMAQLLADLTTLSKLESSDTSRNPAPLNISALLKKIVGDAHQLENFNNHVIDVNIEPDLWLTAVENELYSAFSNLVFNAVRHTPAGTAIQIRASASDAGLTVEIEDNGPGIDSKHLPRITERFYRADVSRNSGTGGTGLGLAIVKHAINAQNGQLEIESSLGKGSKFSCKFPKTQLCDPQTVDDADLT